MKNLQVRPTVLAVTAALLLSAPFAAKAELFSEGLLGLKLGQTRVEAMTTLVNAGVVPDVEKAQCSEKVPEKNKAVANRICKLAIQPGSQYLGLDVEKVTFLYQDEVIVLIGLYVSGAGDSFSALHSTYRARWGAASKEAEGTSASWKEPLTAEPQGSTLVNLWADTANAFVVYSYSNVQ
jgi:hypothetical protein